MSEEKTKFLVTLASDGKFESMGGSRDWLKINDLGLSEATNGKYDAWKTRAAEMGGTSGRHFHNYDFQIMFVLKGWVKMYYEGEGEMVYFQTFKDITESIAYIMDYLHFYNHERMHSSLGYVSSVEHDKCAA